MVSVYWTLGSFTGSICFVGPSKLLYVAAVYTVRHLRRIWVLLDQDFGLVERLRSEDIRGNIWEPAVSENVLLAEGNAS